MSILTTLLGSFYFGYALLLLQPWWSSLRFSHTKNQGISWKATETPWKSRGKHHRNHRKPEKTHGSTVIPAMIPSVGPVAASAQATLRRATATCCWWWPSWWPWRGQGQEFTPMDLMNFKWEVLWLIPITLIYKINILGLWWEWTIKLCVSYEISKLNMSDFMLSN